MNEFTLEIQTPVGRGDDVAALVHKYTPTSQSEYIKTQLELEPIQKSLAEKIPIIVEVMMWVGWYVDGVALWQHLKAYVMKAHEEDPGTGPFIIRMKCNGREKELLLELEDPETIKDALATFREICKEDGS